MIDLTGQKFGALTVIGRAPNSADGKARWVVRCSCGKEFLAIGAKLRIGKTTSCGHTRFEKRQISISGERFGKLVALERIGSKSRQSIWLCRCDCGNTAKVSLGNLRSGHTTSCGCAKTAAQNDPTARVEAIKQSQNTGRFDTNRSAKAYILTNGELKFEFRNMRKFVREHPSLFGISDTDEEIYKVSGRLSDAARNGHKYRDWSVTISSQEEHARKRKFSESAKRRFSEFNQKGMEAAMKLPECQRGPQNRTAKIWVLIDPIGNRIPIVNLLDWCRENYTLFEPPCENIDKAARRVASGFRAIASSMRGVKSRKHPVSTYKGWSLEKIPIKKEDKK